MQPTAADVRLAFLERANGPAKAATIDPKDSRPFLKWAGGKTRLLRHLLPFAPATIVDYYEPFVGGGAMYFALRERVAGRSYLSDLNDELVNTWQVVQAAAEDLGAALVRYASRDSEEFYYSVRPMRPSDPTERAARFIYLNQTAWNGLWRVNKGGEFNVPWGARAFRGMPAEQLLSLEGLLDQTSIELKDFRTALREARAGDFVYLDPPYLPVSDTSKFYFYTERRFRAPDLEELAEQCDALSARGVSWLLSNRDTSMVRSLFSEYEVVRMTARRSVAAQNRRDVEPIDSPEVIVIGRASDSQVG